MASGDTKTNQYLDVAANGTRADLPSDTCCETRSQTLIREVAERIMDVEDEVERLENNPDVVDIVDTYEDLEDYDTSTLTDKDIIRVLNDETHDGESTYYRYDKQSDTFTYIGSAGGSGDSGIPTDATIWGASYDATSNKVSSNILNIGSTTSGAKEIVFYPTGGATANTSYIRGFSDGRLSFASSYQQPISFGVGNYNRLEIGNEWLKAVRPNGSDFYIQNISDPVNPQDAATKNYVDTAVSGGGGGTGVEIVKKEISANILARDLFELTSADNQDYRRAYMVKNTSNDTRRIVFSRNINETDPTKNVAIRSNGELFIVLLGNTIYEGGSFIAFESHGASGETGVTNDPVIIGGSFGYYVDNPQIRRMQIGAIDNLTTTSADDALAASQGKVLNDKIGGDLSNLTTTDKSSLINAINELNTRISNL